MVVKVKHDGKILLLTDEEFRMLWFSGIERSGRTDKHKKEKWIADEISNKIVDYWMRL